RRPRSESVKRTQARRVQGPFTPSKNRETKPAHEPDLVVDAWPNAAVGAPGGVRREPSGAAVRVYDHSNNLRYRSRYFLLTPRNGRRKFRRPVHSPSSVLQCTSRMPPPSSSRAHSPALWLTAAWPRPAAASGLYPDHSSVYTIAPGPVRGTTVWGTSSAAPFRRPPRRTSPPPPP